MLIKIDKQFKGQINGKSWRNKHVHKLVLKFWETIELTYLVEKWVDHLLTTFGVQLG